MSEYLPLYLEGKVCKGFGRGSKELGIPTANLDDTVIESLPADLPPGVYFGCCQVDRSPIYSAALSIGWNPFYKNEKKSFEVHVMHAFDEDFYGSNMKVVVLGYVRPEKNFSCKDELIEAIHSDIKNIMEILAKDKYKGFMSDNFFTHSLNICSRESDISSN